MRSVHCKHDKGWLSHVVEHLRSEGYAVVEGVLEQEFIRVTREAMYGVQQRIANDVGMTRLERAGELGVLRLMMKYDPHFFKFLECPEMLAVVDHTVSQTAILHLQNGFILPSFKKEQVPTVFQNKFHQDFRRVLNGFMASVNTMFAFDEFRKDNGGTLIVPGTHQMETQPNPDHLESSAIALECPGPALWRQPCRQMQ